MPCLKDTATGREYPPGDETAGPLARTVHPVSELTGIQASHAFQVRIVPDVACSVSVTCDDNLLPYLRVQNSGTSLRLGLIDGYNYLGVTLLAEVHMPSVAVIDASGASSVRLDSGFSSPGRLTVVLSGASACEAPGISCGVAAFDVSGASEAWVDVGTQRVDLDASGASTLYYGGTPALAVHSLNGGSRIVKVR